MSGGLYNGYQRINNKAQIISLLSPISVREETCNLKEFKKKSCLNCGEQVMATNYLAKCHRVIYYRVPKYGSMAMSRILRQHASAMNYSFI